MLFFVTSSLLIIWITLLGLAHAFTFSVDVQPSQCAPLTISWTGGQPPFRLLVVTPEFAGLNISIDGSSFKDGKGSFNIPSFPVPKGKSLFFAMSDATGPVSGGTSSVMIVGDPPSGASCSSTLPANDFFFSADSDLVQCRDFPFTQYQGAIKPLTIFAFIPGGSGSFIIPFSPPDADSFTWKANITAQTQVTFWVIDSQNRGGGIDKMRTVAPSTDTSCLVAPPPSTTGSSTSSSTGTQTSDIASSSSPASTQPSQGQPDQSQTEKRGISTGAIIGIAIGAALIIALFCAFPWRWMRRRYRSQRADALVGNVPPSAYSPPPHSGYSSHTPYPIPTSPFSSPPRPAPAPPPMQYVTEPFVPPVFVPQDRDSTTTSFNAYSSPQSHPYSATGKYHAYNSEPSAPSQVGTSSSSGSRPQYVVHRDSASEVGGPVDLPPHYVDRRGPITTLYYHGNVGPIDPLHPDDLKNG